MRCEKSRQRFGLGFQEFRVRERHVPKHQDKRESGGWPWLTLPRRQKARSSPPTQDIKDLRCFVRRARPTNSRMVGRAPYEEASCPAVDRPSARSLDSWLTLALGRAFLR